MWFVRSIDELEKVDAPLDVDSSVKPLRHCSEPRPSPQPVSTLYSWRDGIVARVDASVLLGALAVLLLQDTILLLVKPHHIDSLQPILRRRENKTFAFFSQPSAACFSNHPRGHTTIIIHHRTRTWQHRIRGKIDIIHSSSPEQDRVSSTVECRSTSMLAGRLRPQTSQHQHRSSFPKTQAWSR